MSDVVLKVENLTKCYTISVRMPAGRPGGSLRDSLRRDGEVEKSEFRALDDVSFQVGRGEVVGVIGRNGAGKSTLLKILSRITEPTTGRVTIRGRVGSLLEVGTGFHPELSGRDNVYLNGAILGMKRDEIGRKFDEIVAFAEVARFIDTPVKRYSSGMYVRLAFAVAAHLEPEVMIVDEVLAVGDIAFQNKCLGKMKDVAGDGRTVLFVSHNLPSIISLCGSGLLLESGRLTMAGTAREVVGRYLQTIGAADGEVPLYDRTDRSGDGSARVVSLHVRSTDADGVVRINSGLNITVGYRSERPVRFPSIRIGIDDHSVGIFGLDSAMAGGLPESIPPDGKIGCTTGAINLAPGRYYLHVLLEHAGVAADYIQGAGYFDVEAEDVFGSGRIPDREWAICVLPHRWHLDEE